MAYAPMFESWEIRDDGVGFEITLDLGHAEEFPVAGRGWFFGVRVPMTRSSEAGSADETELARLDVVENRVRSAVKAREGLYVGRRTGGGNRDLVFYMDERPAGLEERLRASVGMELLFISRRDPAWGGYQSMLPGPQEWRQIEDRRTVNALLNMDADPEAPHQVEHRVSTGSVKAAEALVKFCEKLELSPVTIEGDRPEWTVVGVQVSPLSVAAIHHVSWNLEAQSPKVRGKYLGWTAEPVLREDAAGLGDDDDDLSDLGEDAEDGGEEGLEALLARMLQK